jgi:RNA recognition motif-containing protein
MRPARIDTLPAHCVPGFRRLFIGGLKENTSEDALRKYAQQFGEVTDVTMVTRFGLVTFAYRHDAEKALRSNRTYTSIAKSRVRYLLHSLDYLMCCLVLCCIIRVVPS